MNTVEIYISENFRITHITYSEPKSHFRASRLIIHNNKRSSLKVVGFRI